MPDHYHPTEVLQAFRQENPHRFDDVNDGELLDALKVEDPDTYKLVDPQLIGAELLGDSRTFGQPIPDLPPKPLPTVHPAPSTAERVISTAVRTGPMLVGGALGFLGGGPGGAAAIGAGGGAIGDVGAQAFERSMGTREDYSPMETLIQAGLGAVPLGEVAGMGPAAATVIRAGQGAMLGRAGGLAESLVTGQPPGPALPEYATGAVFGGALHGAGEVYGMAKNATGDLSPEAFNLPQGAGPPPDPTGILAEVRRLEAQEIAKEFAKRGWDIPPAQRGTLQYGLETKSYLDRLAELNQPPLAIPETFAPPPPGPPQPAGLLPPSPIIGYGPEGPPTQDLVVPGSLPRGVQAQPTIDRLTDELGNNLGMAPGPPRLSTTRQIQLRRESPGHAQPEGPPLLERGGAPPGRPQRLIQKRATPEQPYLAGATQPQPLDRQYTQGPNAGPRREGELHGQPRSVRRQVEIPGGGYRYETVPSTLHAEDPGTYPPEVRREMARMLWELQERPYERVGGGTTQGQLEALAEDLNGKTSDAVAEARRRGASAGGAIAGAPVYHDIKAAAGGARAHAQRAEMIQDLRAALLEGKGSHLSDAAAEVARQRLAQEARGGLTPTGNKAGTFTAVDTGRTRQEGYTIISAPGRGDDLIGWVDESGTKALPDQDLSPEQQAARDDTDGELLMGYRMGQRHGIPEGLEPHFQAITDELVRRGLIRPEQQALAMEGPGGAKGPTLFDFEGTEPPKKPEPQSQKTLLPTQQNAIDELEQQLVDRYGEDMSQWPEHLRQGGTFVEQGPIHWGIPPEAPPEKPGESQIAPIGTNESQPELPGTEGVRDQDLPTPEVAEAPFALTPPPAKPEFGSKASAQRSLFDRLKGEEGVLILDVPHGDRKGLKKWLDRQEKTEGGAVWFHRAQQAIQDGDWDRAWKVAASASVRSYAKAYDQAKTPQQEEALRRAVKGTPLQANIQAEIISQARRKGIPREERAPYVEDFPPSARVSQAGAARGRATLGPAGVINPGPPQKPLEGKYTDFTLSKNLQQSLIEASDPSLLHLIPGNTDTNLRLYRQIADLSFRGANTRELKQYLKLPDEEIAQHYLRGVQEAARTLQQLSAFAQINQKTLNKAAEAMSMGGALEGMLGGEPPSIVGARGRVIGRVGSIEPERTLEALAESTRTFDQAMLTNSLQKPRKASELELLQSASYPFMISKWATAVRNAATQAGRFGVEALDEAFTIPIARLLGDRPTADLATASTVQRLRAPFRKGVYVPPTRAWKDTLQDIFDMGGEVMENLSPEDGRATLKVLNEFPTEAANFLGWASSAGEEVGGGASKFRLINSLLNPRLQKLLTVFNRAQEFTGRALVFDASMRAQLQARGLDPSEILQLPPDQVAQRVGGATALDELVHNSVAGALEATFASRASKDSIPGALLRFVNTAWPLKLGYPFPKFNLSAAPRFIWDHGPWALADLVRFPLDAAGLTSSSLGGSRLYRGIRAQRYERAAIPELVGKRAAAELKLGTSVRDLVASRRELAVRNRMVTRLERKAQAGLPDLETPLEQAVAQRDALSRRVDRAQASIGEHKSTIRDLRSQEERLLEAVRDAHGIGAPNLSQYFARIGTGTFVNLAAAFVIRSQAGAQGTRWYEYRVEREGKDPITLDFRPFAPFAQYLFVADVMQDFDRHTDWSAVKADMAENAGPIDWSRSMWNHYTGKYTGQELGGQFAEAFLSMSRAAGTTLTILDLMKANGWPSPQEAADAVVGTIGQFLSRFTVPAQQLKDIAGGFDPEEAKARITPRATLDEPYRPLADPIANIPYASRVIPERISQTTGRPVATEYPLLRALAGIGTAPKDFVTQEVQRIGVPGQSVFIRETGDYPLDRLVAETYSRVLQQQLPAILEDPQYTALGTPADQRDYLQRYIFPVLKRASLAEVRQSLGEERFQEATVKGEGARRKQRQLELLERLTGELGPTPPEDQDQPPGPPPGLSGAPPPPPF